MKRWNGTLPRLLFFFWIISSFNIWVDRVRVYFNVKTNPVEHAAMWLVQTECLQAQITWCCCEDLGMIPFFWNVVWGCEEATVRRGNVSWEMRTTAGIFWLDPMDDSPSYYLGVLSQSSPSYASKHVARRIASKHVMPFISISRPSSNALILLLEYVQYLYLQ